MLHVGNTQNENITTNNSSMWSLWGKLFDKKGIMRAVFPANLLANVLTRLNNTGNYTTHYT